MTPTAKKLQRSRQFEKKREGKHTNSMICSISQWFPNHSISWLQNVKKEILDNGLCLEWWQIWCINIEVCISNSVEWFWMNKWNNETSPYEEHYYSNYAFFKLFSPFLNASQYFSEKCQDAGKIFLYPYLHWEH